MSKGKVFFNKFTSYPDETTGRKITKLTSEGTVNHHPYFYNKMITNDNKNLIYCSNIDENRNLYLLMLETGETKQLTNSDSILDFSPCLSGDDKYLFFGVDNGIIKMDMQTLNEEQIYKNLPEWQFEFFGMSNDDKAILACETKRSDIVGEGRNSIKGDWSKFEAQWRAQPNCKLIYIEVETGEYKTVLNEEKCWLGHPQIRPHNNKELSYCHEGPGPLIDARLWLINEDGSNKRCATPRTENEEVTTHEYWLNDGSKMAYMHRECNGITTIWYVNPATLEREEFMECSHFCHFISNKNNTLIVGDGQPPKEDYLYLIDVANKIETKLCRHGSTFKTYGNTQDAHPHAVFSYDSAFVIFSSDKDGSPNVYKCEL